MIEIGLKPRARSPVQPTATTVREAVKAKCKQRYVVCTASLARWDWLIRYSCALTVLCIVLLSLSMWHDPPTINTALPARLPPVLQDQRAELQPSLEFCQSHYGNLTFLPPEQLHNTSESAIPPLLLSYPGSGNTYLRAVLEYATSLHSGSIYKRDPELGRIFPGERLCSRELGSIKGHPPDFIIIEEMDSRNEVMASAKGDKRKRLRPRPRDLRIKCLRGSVKYWPRVIFLARSPFAAILSETQRQFSGSHSGTVPRAGLNSTLKRFGGMKVSDLWLDRSILMANEYNGTFDSIVGPILDQSPASVSNHGVSTLFVAHFDEIIKDTVGRVDVLSNLMRVIYPDLPAPRDKIQCAYMLADKRPGILRTGVRKLSASDMYSKIDPTLPCRMLPSLEHFLRHPLLNYSASPNPAFKSIFDQCQQQQTHSARV